MSSDWHLYWSFVDLLGHFSFCQYTFSFLLFNTTLSMSCSLCYLPLMCHFEGTSLKWKIITSSVLQQEAAMLHKLVWALLCKERRLHKWLTLQPWNVKNPSTIDKGGQWVGRLLRSPRALVEIASGHTEGLYPNEKHCCLKKLSVYIVCSDLFHFNFVRFVLMILMPLSFDKMWWSFYHCLPFLSFFTQNANLLVLLNWRVNLY